MNICTRHIRPQAPSSGRPTRRQWRWALVCGLLLVLSGAPATSWAQVFFPGDVPVPIFTDDFEAAGALGNWTVYQLELPPLPAWTAWQLSSDVVPEVANGHWGLQHLRENAATGGRHTVIAPNISIPGNAGNLPQDWTNTRMEFDFAPSQWGAVGAMWGARDGDLDGRPDDGYLFFIDDFPTRAESLPPEDDGQDLRAWWHLVRLRAGTYVEVGSGPLELDTSDPDLLTAWRGSVYRLRIDFFCDDLRIQIQRVHAPNVPTEYQGCGICPSAGPDDCWCTILEWVEVNTNLTPGYFGLYHAGTNSVTAGDTRFDNVVVSSWKVTCAEMCDDWEPWVETPHDPISFKFLYDAALFDYSLVTSPRYPRIDVATTFPDPVVGQASFCDGWSGDPRPEPRMVGLPSPTAALGTNLADMDRFLQPMATAVKLVNDEGSPYLLGFLDDFDNDIFLPDGVTPNPDYNPIPLVADGMTPIADSLMDAYNWYVETRESEPWIDDTEAECRLWYVVLITDGEESCPPPPGVVVPNRACLPDEAADLFFHPPIDHPEWEPVNIHTIGFSESVADDSPLRCVAENTEGTFSTAANAAELTEALLGVLNNMVENQRSFSPFKVSPPPSPSDDEAFLAVFPFFVPRNDRSIWDGTLFAFLLDSENPTLPVTGDCEIDFSDPRMKWDAGAVLATQLDDFTEANATRHVFMGGTYSGPLLRYDLGGIPANTLLRDEFITRLDIAAGVSTFTAQEIVNFVRYIHVDDDGAASPDPVFPPRPESVDPDDPGGPLLPWAALGDFYHSQPVIVNPPNSSMFFFDFGFGGAGGAHDYRTFMNEQNKRRRVVLAGGNDGMLHAFDGGFWDRDVAGFHDLGSGIELFAYVPHAVMDTLYEVAVDHTEQRYMVDGPTAKGDVFIDSDADDDREWRTVAISTMRRGGRGMVALDITQPDPIGSDPDYFPTESVYPGCLDGTDVDCSGEYPRVIWEFEDTDDADANCPAAPCDDYFDLGWTWSKPAIARIAYYDDTEPTDTNDVFIAFFGGGWDRTEQDRTGNFFYGVNIENGDIVYKSNMGVAVPGSPTALDSDIDGFHDRIYFGDSDGQIYRIEFPRPIDADWSTTGEPVVLHSLPTPATIPDPGLETALFDFRADFVGDRQQFFTRPVMVPALFDGAGYTWAIAMGTGDRANLDTFLDPGGLVDHFFFVLDFGDSTTRGAADLLEVTIDGEGDITDVCNEASGIDTALDPANGRFGWYLSLRPNEKVVFDAKVINGNVLFPTFDPTPDVIATHNPPDLCGEPPPEPPPGEELEAVCAASGLGRSYNLWYECGMGDYSEVNDVITGSEDYTIGGTTYVGWTGTTTTPPETEEFPNVRGHIVTNWRQE